MDGTVKGRVEVEDQPGGESVATTVGFVPTTEFGRRLLELHRQTVEVDGAIETREDLEREIVSRRGGLLDRQDR